MPNQISDLSREIDHTWQQALQTANGEVDVGLASDGLLLRTIGFIQQYNRARTSQAKAKCRRKFPSISLAHQIRFDPQDGRRDAVEALLLAGCSPEKVAVMSAIDPAVVWIYIALFFDLLDRLDAPNFIWSQVVGLQRTNLGDQERERRAKLWLAWLGGPRVAVSLLLPGFAVADVAEKTQVADWWMDVSLELLDRTTVLVSLLGRLDGEQLRQLSRYRVATRQQQEAAQGSQVQQDVLRNVKAFLDGIELTVGAKGIPEGPHRKYYTGPVEPRADEWNAISRGEEVPELDQAMTDKSLRSRMCADRGDTNPDGDLPQDGHNDCQQ